MGTLSSMAVYLYQRGSKDQHDEIIAIEKSIYLIAIFIYTLSKSLNHHHTEQTSEALVEDE